MKYSDLEFSYHYVSFEEGVNSAYISKSTGKVYQYSEVYNNEEDEELPDDFYDNDDYVAVPSKRDLDLGQALIWKFVREEIPGLEDKVREIFSRKGAYRRFRNFLEYNDLRHKWHNFENTKVKEALIQWAEENEIPLEFN